jgi:CrcB protein
MPIIVGVALGGAIGASGRYALDRFIEARSDAIFPWATFVVNVTGCLFIGIVAAALVDRHHLPAWLRIGVVVGIVGGYTTFSTFAQESLDLVDARRLTIALAYMALSVVAGVGAVSLGSWLGRSI